MPRSPRKKETAVVPSTSLVASAARYEGKSAPRIFSARQSWQVECYRHVTICGEARAAAKFFGHAMSRVVLEAGTVGNDGVFKPGTGQIKSVHEALFNGRSGQTQMMDSLGVHLTIAGEAYLIGRTVEDLGEVWEVVSVMEVEVNGRQWWIKTGGDKYELKDDDVVIRIWLPDETDRTKPTSAFRALLPVLREIEFLTRHVFRQITTRLAGAGILFLPQGMTFPPPPAVAGKEVQSANEAESFMLTLADSMMESIEDESLPSSNVPTIVTAPDDSIDKARLMQFWSELDGRVTEMRDGAIRRFALGMDLPPEQVMGMSSNGGTGGGNSNGISHWGAWQVEESTIKMHIEPMCEVIIAALTMEYLRNMVADAKARYHYDTSALRLRPDRSQQAIEMYDRGLLSVTALYREVGFDDSDAPTPAEFQRWLLIKIATGSATPEQMQAALVELGVTLEIEKKEVPPQLQQPQPPEDKDEEPRENPPPPSLEDHPTRPRDPSENAALIAASEGLIFRALERAGNRLRQMGGKPPGVPSYETHTLVRVNGNAEKILEDAWSCAPQVLSGIADPEKVIPVLQGYVTTLFAEQSKHDRERLVEWLAKTAVDA